MQTGFEVEAEGTLLPEITLRPRRALREWASLHSVGTYSRPLLGLPLRRWIPQDVHSLLDYSASAALAASRWLAAGKTAAGVGLALSFAGAGVSLLTDYKLSLAKVIPIEVHEGIDYVWGLSAVLAPFAFGYWKRERLASVLQIAVGATTLLGSLFTDYRALRGVSWADARRALPAAGL